MIRPQPSYPMDSGLSVSGEDAASASPPEPGSPREVHRGIPFTLCVLPLICYLASPGQPPGGQGFARVHAGQALALSLTALLYALCGLIVFGVLALDSLQVAAVIAVPLLALLWLSVLAVVVCSAIVASRGEFRPVPRWLRLTQEPPVSR
jgi:hypothetical protein